jgi:TPR repeat protein
MTRSTTPVTEQPDWHPVHRANALLRQALQGATKSFEALEARYSVESLSDAIDSVMNGPVQITYPKPLAVRLDDLDIEERTVPGLERYMHLKDEPSDRLADFDGCDFEDFTDEVAAPVEPDEALSVAAELWDDYSGEGRDEPEPPKADIARGSEPAFLRPQLHVHTLMGEFRRRQRHASLLVAASIGTAILLTIGGVVLAASFASARPTGGDDLSRTTTVVWQPPGTKNDGVQLAVMSANRAAKHEALSVRPDNGTTRGPVGASPIAPQILLAASGRRIAFGTLLPPIHARYFLVRGLPPKSTLSGGRQSGAGAWLIKGEHVSGVTLSLGDVAAGDYPVEIYILESGDGPQARRNFVLRVAPSDRIHAAASNPNASLAASRAPGAPAIEEPTTPPHAAVLRARSAQLLGEGDIAAARLLLLHLAERGDGEAAYDLARTFDGQMLAELGAEGLDGDPARARGWYERASQVGNVKAAERLKILASLSGAGPSD